VRRPLTVTPEAGPDAAPEEPPPVEPPPVEPPEAKAPPPVEPPPPPPRRPVEPPPEPQDVHEALLSALRWLADGVAFDLLETLWPAPTVQRTLGHLRADGDALVDLTRRTVSLAPERRAEADPADHEGRALAQRALLSAYGERAAYRSARIPLLEAELARHVTALAAALPAHYDDEGSARLFARAGVYLLRYGDSRAGVGLCERALARAEVPRSPFRDRRSTEEALAEAQSFTGDMAVESYEDLIDLAIDADLDAFVALSPRTVAAGYGAGGETHRIHGELAGVYEQMRQGDPRALPVCEGVLTWATRRLGPYHHITLELSDAVMRLRSGGS
jgi:hypothetical protein